MTSRHRTISNERGFTLAEVLVAAGVIMAGLIAVASAFPYAMSGVESGKQQSTATFLAEQRLEELRGLAVIDADLTTAPFAFGTSTEASVPGYPRYTRATTITNPTPAIPIPTTRVVQVTVSYTPAVTVSATNPTRSLTVATVLATRR